MNILSIASVYPVKDTPYENPYVINFLKHYKEKYDAEFTVLKPESFLPTWLIKFSNRKKYWRQKKTICKTGYYQSNNVSVYVLPYFSIGSLSALHAFFSLFVSKSNRKRIKGLNLTDIEIIHAHFLFPDGLIAYQLSKKYNIPYVLTIRQELRFLNNKYSLNWVKKLIQNAFVVTTHSPQMLEGLKKIGINNVKLLSTGIEEYFFENKQSTVSRKDKKRKLSLLSVCNLLPIKNLETVLRAISKMTEKQQIDYTIYGSGPLEQKLKELVAELQLGDIIHFKGAVENKKLPDIMREYDVFIQPSFKETLGLSYFEALACGLPVILTENTGVYEMIKDKDVYYVVDPHDTESIAGCLKGIIEDRKTLNRKAALAPDVAKIASWEGFVDYFHETYEEVVSERLTPCPP